MRRIRLSVSIAASLAIACPAYAAPALDGSAQGSACSATNPTATLTTAQTNDVIIAIAGDENNDMSSPAPTMTISGGGLTWHKEWDINDTGSGNLSVYVDRTLWYAVAASTLTSQTITATLSGSTDASGLVVFGVSGADTSTIFDQAGQCETTGTGIGTPSISGVYSNSASVFEVATDITPNLDSVSASPTGFTDIQYVQNSGCTHKYYYERVAYQVYTSAISNATYSWVGSWGLQGHSVSAVPVCGLGGSCAGSVRSTCPLIPGTIPSGNHTIFKSGPGW